MSNRLQTILETVQQILSEVKEGETPTRRSKDFTSRFKKGSKPSHSPRRGLATHEEENEEAEAARKKPTHRVR